MASSNVSINANAASLEELKTIPNIGEKRANAIIKFRQEKGALTVEDAIQITGLPNTFWDPLVSDGTVNFGHTVQTMSLEDALKHIKDLEIKLHRQAKHIEGKDIRIAQCENEIATKQSEIKHKENTFQTQFKEQAKALQDNYDKEANALLQKYTENLQEERKTKKHEIQELKQKLTDQEDKYVGRVQYLEARVNQLEEQKLKLEIEKAAPDGIYRKSKQGDGESSHMKGPAPPKMSTFDGKSDWRPFYTQFTHIASRYKWTDQQRLDKLIECLRDRALKYFSSRPAEDQDSFKKLSAKLDERFGKKDLPHIIRRQLQDIKQDPDDSIEEFADKVQEMTTDGYPDTPDNCRQTVAIDAFLRGCQNKQAALTAMDKNPLTLDDAIQHMKSAITNQRLILGAKKTEVKRVKFETCDEESEEEGEISTVRAIYSQNKTQNTEQTNYSKLEFRMKKIEDDNRDTQSKLKEILQILTNGNQNQFQRSRSNSNERITSSKFRSPQASPSRWTCFNCDQEGHFARDCPQRRNRSPSPQKTSKPLNFQGLEK